MKTILCVDDEPSVAKLCSTVLQRAGFEVLEAASGEAAVRCFNDARGRVDLLLSDVDMPQMTGPELAIRLKQAKPDLAILFMSGSAVGIESLDAIAPGAVLLPKPFLPGTLVQLVRWLTGVTRQKG